MHSAILYCSYNIYREEEKDDNEEKSTAEIVRASICFSTVATTINFALDGDY